MLPIHLCLGSGQVADGLFLLDDAIIQSQGCAIVARDKQGLTTPKWFLSEHTHAVCSSSHQRKHTRLVSIQMLKLAIAGHCLGIVSVGQAACFWAAISHFRDSHHHGLGPVDPLSAASLLFTSSASSPPPPPPSPPSIIRLYTVLVPASHSASFSCSNQVQSCITFVEVCRPRYKRWRSRLMASCWHRWAAQMMVRWCCGTWPRALRYAEQRQRQGSPTR